MTGTIKENIMKNITREWSYKTSDGKVFLGESAEEKAKEYQKRLNFKRTIKDIIPKAREILNIEEPNPHEDGVSDEEKLLDKMDNKLYWSGEDFKDFLYWLITIYFEIPELSKFFQFVEEKFDEYK